jgi:hypothetical protein
MITVDSMGLAAFCMLFSHDWVTVTTDRKTGVSVTFDMTDEQFEEIKQAWKEEEDLRSYYTALRDLFDARQKARHYGAYDNPKLLGLLEKN